MGRYLYSKEIRKLLVHFYESQEKVLKKRIGKDRKVYSYWPSFCCYDTETSKRDFSPLADQEKGLHEWHSWVYLWTFQLDGDTTIYGRTLEDFCDFVNIMEEESQRVSDARHYMQVPRTVIYVHNLSFEWSFLFSRMLFNTEDCFFRERRKPIYCRTGSIEFRCSYILTNMSLAAFLKNMSVQDQKLSGQQFDYFVTRYPWTPLTDYELDYASHDVSGLYQALSLKLAHDKDTITTVPWTSTGYVRRDCMNACKPIRRKLRYIMPDLKRLNLLTDAFRGGNTHADREHVATILKDVKSMDESSAYPSTQLLFDFPMGEYQFVSPTLENLMYFLSRNYSVVMRVEFTDLYLKNDYEPIPYLSVSKCEVAFDNTKSDDMKKSEYRQHVRRVRRGKLDNGRLLGCRYCKTALTEIDLQIVLDQYDFKSMNILECMVAKKAPLPDEYRQVIKNYFVQKSELKYVERDAYLEYIYFRYKALLNSVFGMSCMNPLKNLIRWDPNKYDYYEEIKPIDQIEQDLKNAAFPYQWGVYVTAYGRAMLQEGIDAVKKYMVHPVQGETYVKNVEGRDYTEEPKSALVYCDTDSVKYIEIPGIAEEFEKINQKRKALCDQKGAYVDVNGKRIYLSLYEDDGKYTQFITQGAKRYAYICNGKEGEEMHITVSGVSKGINEDTGKPFAVDEMESLENFKKGQQFTISGGTISFYDDTTDFIYNPDNQPDHDIHIMSGVSIVETTYTMGFADDYLALLDHEKLFTEWKKVINNESV